MIPRIPGCKTVIFQPRVTVYHQTFSPLGKANESLGIVWHSGLMGRNGEDVSSAYVAALRSIQCRHIQFLTIWVDNCSAQNKYWTIFTALCLASCISITEVTLKYFEKGHTFMSCDSFHHSVEQGMRDAKNINMTLTILRKLLRQREIVKRWNNSPTFPTVAIKAKQRRDIYFLERKIQRNRFFFDAILESGNKEDNQR